MLVSWRVSMGIHFWLLVGNFQDSGSMETTRPLHYSSMWKASMEWYPTRRHFCCCFPRCGAWSQQRSCFLQSKITGKYTILFEAGTLGDSWEIATEYLQTIDMLNELFWYVKIWRNWHHGFLPSFWYFPNPKNIAGREVFSHKTFG